MLSYEDERDWNLLLMLDPLFYGILIVLLYITNVKSHMFMLCKNVHSNNVILVII